MTAHAPYLQIERIVVKIEKTSTSPPAIAEGRSQAVSKDKPSPSPAAQQESTSVSLGATATQLHSMANSMASTPAVANAGKIAEIKQAISDGRFKVNASVVADRLIESVRELISSRA